MASTMRFDNWQTTDGTSIATTNASGDITFAGAVSGAGKILQVVRATDSTERTTTSSTVVDANISVTITPTSATSNILLVWSVHVDSRPGTQATSTLYITDSSNTVLDGTGDVSHGLVAATRNLYRSTFIAWASPATTSATTYKGRFQANSGSTSALLNHLAIGQLFALEIGA